MSAIKNYIYVDAHYEHPNTKQRMRWVRMQEGDIGRRIVEPSNHSNCYATVQRFHDSVSLRDIKRGLAALGEENGASDDKTEREALEANLQQQLHYCGLYFDFDCDYKKLDISEAQALSRSQVDCQKLIAWFINELKVHPNYIQIWFSGKKGFHCVVRPEVFAMKPNMHLTYIIKNAANQLATLLSLETLDTSVYSIPRMWRIANTRHPSTSRYKVELLHEELMGWDIDQIIKCSEKPRNPNNIKQALPISHLIPLSVFNEIEENKKAVSWWEDFMQLYDIHVDMTRLRPTKPIVKPTTDSQWPVCVGDIMEEGPKPSGPNRNRVLLPVVGFMRDVGVERIEAHKMVRDWTMRFYPEQHKLQDRILNGKTVVETAYNGGLRFSCQAIRGNSGSSSEEKVECVGIELCPWIIDPKDQTPEKTPMLHLSDASKGCYMNTKVRMPVHVAAIAGHPFDLPAKGKIECNENASKKLCSICRVPQNRDFEFSVNDDSTLELIGVTKSVRKSVIRRKVGVPENCFKAKIEITEHSNLEEVQIIPMVDFAQAGIMGNDDDTEAAKTYRHVVRRGFHLGHGIKANSKYIVDAKVMANPKDQRICFLFDKAEPAQNDIDQFIMNPERYQNLRAFQRHGNQTVEEKFIEIHRDLTANVHQIGGRFDLSIAFDLCYHSVIGFEFAGKRINKGWFELLVLGDSGVGKTTMIERIMQHYGLGELIAGEDARRTGLVYASIQMQGQWILRWGKIPTQDRRLLVIDEFSGIPQEEVGKMTQLRSEGRARGGGVNSDYETWARTRLILLTNPRDNKGKLAGFTYGIQAVEALFKEAQDLRRVDFAVIAEADEVDNKLINRRWDNMDVKHYYTADLCRNLVLWAWSREPHHVEWRKGAEDEVLLWAERLGDVYECDISLAQRSDLRLKIARISAAVAARLFSTDEEAKKLYIEVEHVQFAAKFMDRSYRKGPMGYFEYARKYKEENHFSKEKKKNVKKHLEGYHDSDIIVSTLLDVELITKPTLTDMVNLEDSDLKKLWKFLIANKLIRKKQKGFRKTDAFTKFLKSIGFKNTGYAGELSDNFESGGDFGCETEQKNTKDLLLDVNSMYRSPIAPESSSMFSPPATDDSAGEYDDGCTPAFDPPPIFEDGPPIMGEPPIKEQMSFFSNDDIEDE